MQPTVRGLGEPPVPSEPRVTTTAAALLALLQAGPMSTAVWLREYHKTFGHCWDRTNALLYEQIRRLQASGLVSESAEGSLRRHTLTSAGGDVLRSWGASGPNPPRMDLEAAVRLIIDDADHARHERTIGELARWASEHVAALDRLVAIGSTHLEGEARAVDLLRRLYRSVHEWAMEQTDQADVGVAANAQAAGPTPYVT